MQTEKPRISIPAFHLVFCLFCFAQTSLGAEIFEPEGRVICEGRIFAVAGYDFNHDGHIDLVVSDFKNPSRILYGAGGLDFAEFPLNTIENRFTGGHGLALEDFNRDSNIDIFLLYNGHPSRLLLGDKNDKFTDSGQDIGESGLNATSVTAADVDNDKDLDVFMTYYQNKTRLYLNDGKGGFEVTDQNFGDDGHSVASGDTDNDGTIDIICRRVDKTAWVWRNVEGVFFLREDSLGDDSSWGPILLEDIDQDKDLDLIMGSRDLDSSLWLNDGKGNFAGTEQSFNPGVRLAGGDIDNDGDRDLIVGDTVWLNNGKGQFTKHQTFSLPRTSCISLIDIDGDKDPDLFIGQMDPRTGAETLKVYLNIQ